MVRSTRKRLRAGVLVAAMVLALGASACSTTGGMACASSTGGAGGAAPLANPYPTRTAYRIKGLQPDFWPTMADIAGNNTGGVAMNMVWASWEASVQAPPCDADTMQEYDGHCFLVDPNADAAIVAWTAAGVVVTGVVYGVPTWAQTPACSPPPQNGAMFCAPANAADYGRYAGMLAQRYDGLHGHGRIADFVIHNEVNSNGWFDVGCGLGVPCQVDEWISTYADSYDAAYDAVVAEQPAAKVLVSLDHSFGSSLDAPAQIFPLLSGETFLTGFAAHAGGRAWRVAFHPYAEPLTSPTFSADDYPYVTYGNIGVLSGWLHAHFPGVPSAFEIQLTESGVNSLAPSTQAAQVQGVCSAFQNVLGTPGIENYIYHRMVDNPVEVDAGIGLGLHDVNDVAKMAWSTWALANRNDLSPPQLSCGFEALPYTLLTRSFDPSRGHWTSSRIAPSGFTTEGTWHLLRDQAPGTVALYECVAATHNLITLAEDCEGQQPMGPVGYIYTCEQAGAVELYRCTVGASTDSFVSPSSTCEGQTVEGVLGWALP